jgi:hypothetical protein
VSCGNSPPPRVELRTWAADPVAQPLALLAGSSALDLKDPRQALSRFSAAQTDEYGAAGHVRDSVLYLTRTARGHLELGDLDSACTTGLVPPRRKP